MNYLFAIINPDGTTKSSRQYKTLAPIRKKTKLSNKEINDIIYNKITHDTYRIHRKDDKGRWI